MLGRLGLAEEVQAWEVPRAFEKVSECWQTAVDLENEVLEPKRGNPSSLYSNSIEICCFVPLRSFYTSTFLPFQKGASPRWKPNDHHGSLGFSRTSKTRQTNTAAAGKSESEEAWGWSLRGFSPWAKWKKSDPPNG